MNVELYLNAASCGEFIPLSIIVISVICEICGLKLYTLKSRAFKARIPPWHPQLTTPPQADEVLKRLQ
jgi:hypothetical protein